jgi:hypothetical protein
MAVAMNSREEFNQLNHEQDFRSSHEETQWNAVERGATADFA